MPATTINHQGNSAEIESLLNEASQQGVYLYIEDHKLKFKSRAAGLSESLKQALSHHKTAIIHYLSAQESPRRKGLPAIVAKTSLSGKPAKLSYAQQRMWFLNQFIGDNAVYNAQLALRMAGGLNEHALTQAIEEIFKRHQTLRTRFELLNDEVVQVIDPVSFVLQSEPVQDLAAVYSISHAERHYPFNLARDSLCRVRLLQETQSRNHILLITMHHSISDGWSAAVLLKELTALYLTYQNGEMPALPALPIQYADYAMWQRECVQQQHFSGQLAYWRDQLSGMPARLCLPTDRPRPAEQTYHGDIKRIRLSKALSGQVLSFVKAQNVTLYMTLMSAFAVLLSRYSGQKDIALGTPIANRTRQETESLIGFFANTLVMRCDLHGDPNFYQVIEKTRDMALEAYQHQDIPFEQLVEELNPERNLSYSPLFQVMFTVRNVPDHTDTLRQLGFELLAPQYPGTTDCQDEKEHGVSHFDMTFNLTESQNGILGVLEYNTDLFDGETIEALLAQYQQLLQALILCPAAPISTLSPAQPTALLLPDALASFPEDAVANNLLRVICQQLSLHPQPTPPELLLLNDALQPVMPGAVGELYIRGLQLSAGLPTGCCMVERPGADGTTDESLIRTGEFARLTHSGVLVFADSDECVRACEIAARITALENLLSAHPDVRNAYIVEANGIQSPNLVASQRQVVAYVAAPEKTADGQSFGAALKKYVRTQPAQYLLPTAVVVLDTLPLNSRGQVDVQALPEINELKALKPQYMAPRTETETRLCQIWQQLLNVEKVGVLDNFFMLGGHSLLATRLVMAIRDQFAIELPLKSLFKMPTVAQLAESLSDAHTADPGHLKEIKADRENWYQPFPLTGIQQAYLLGRSSAFELGNIATHAYGEMTITDLAVDRFSAALNRLIQRHGMLRAIFDMNSMTQRILEHVPVYNVEYLDLSSMSAQDREAQLMIIREKMSHQVLSHDKWPLFEMRVTRVNERDYRLHYSRDALISDAASQKIFRTELFQLYETPDVELPEFDISFRDYVLAEEAIKKSQLFEKAKAYWHARLEDFPAAPELPLAKKPNAISQPHFVTYLHQIDQEGWQQFRSRSQSLGVTPTVLIMTLFAQILNRWSKHSHFALNLTLFNRLPLHSQVNQLFGDFTSLTLLAIEHQKDDTLQDAARRIQEQLWSDLEHRYFGGTDMLRALNAKAGAAQAVAMPVVFTSTLGLEQDEKQQDEQTATVATKRKSGFSVSQTPQVWLDHGVVSTPQGLVLKWSVLEELFPVGMIDEMFQAYKQLVDYVADASADMDLSYVELLARFGGHAKLYPAESAIVPERSALMHELFHQQVPASRDKVAVVDGEVRLSYGKLERYALAIAGQLTAHGVQPNQLVAVVMDKGWEQVAAVLGIQYAGAAYLPIDAALPNERIELLVSEGKVAHILTQRHLSATMTFFSGLGLHVLDISSVDIQHVSAVTSESFKSVQSETDLAYVIFTSGSTGKPKGVMIDHRGAVNTILDVNQRFAVTSNDKVLAISNLNFDLSVYDIFGLLAVGGTIVMPERGQEKNPAHWLKLIRQEAVSIWNAVPALAELYIEEVERQQDEPTGSANIRLFMLSGDWINLDLPPRLAASSPNADIISLGGATEASIWSICYPIKQIESHWKSIPYGKSMKNQDVYILDDNLAEKPCWGTGNIYIGGKGVAKGYWGDAEKTANSFIRHPVTGAQLYRTGDLGRYWPDGNIEFLGRDDNQVKIHGHRIELGEIEAALNSHSRVRESIAVVTGEGQHKHLAAYIVPHAWLAGESESMQPPNSRRSAQDSFEQSVFKLEQRGLLDVSKQEIKLPFAAKSCNEALSVCQFENGLIYSQIVREQKQKTLLTMAALGDWLSALRQLHLDATEHPLPKRYYPSAGSLYPVQVYLGINQGTFNQDIHGLYYYDPAVHQLVLIDPSYNAGQELCLYFVSQKDAIEPLYGNSAERFSLLEAGHMLQLLESTSLLHSLAVKEVDADTGEARHPALPLTANQQLLCTRAVIAVSAEKQWAVTTQHCLARQSYRQFLPTAVSPEIITLLLGTMGTLACQVGVQIRREDDTQDFYLYDPYTRSLRVVASSVALSEPLHGGANSNIYQSSGVTIYLMAVASELSPQLWLEAGHFGQHLMNRCTDHLLGFCPIGNMNFEPVARAMSVDHRTQLLYAFVGGAVSAQQLQSWPAESGKRQSIELIDEQELQHYLASRLPFYLVPHQFKQLPFLPLTTNGKIDRKSLPAFECAPQHDVEKAAPEGIVEELLEKMWCSLLGCDNVGRRESFFTLGGHSLLAIQLASRVRDVFEVELPMRVFFELQTIQQQAHAISQHSKTMQMQPIEVVDYRQPQRLSYAQQRLWFIDQLGGGSAEYNMMGTYILPGALNISAFSKAFDALVKRHQIIRTHFTSVNGEPRQIVATDYQLPLSQQDLSGYPETDKARLISEIAAKEARQPFDLTQDVLLRIHLIKLSDNINLVMYVMHHVASDIWSLGVFKREMHALYQAFCRGEGNPLAPLAVQYTDFAQWQRQWLGQEVLEKQLAYWHRQLADLPAVHNIPLDYVRPAQQVFEGRRYQHNVDAELTGKINLACRKHQVTQFMFLETAFAVLLSRYSNETDIVIGSAISGRNHQDVENLIGFFVNTLVLRTDLSGDPSFSELLTKNKKVILDAYAHQHIPFEMLVEKLRPERNLSYNPLYQVMFALQKQEPASSNNTQVQLSEGEQEALKRIQQSLSMKSSTRFDLLVHAAEQTNSFTINWLYNEALFHESTIARLGQYYVSLLQSIVSELLDDNKAVGKQQKPVSQLPILTCSGQELLFAASHGDVVHHPQNCSLHEYFELQAAKTPHNIAVQCGRESLTYQALNQTANSIARYLMTQGVTSGQRVAVCVENSVELMIGLLAVLKSGGAYLPLSPDLPTARMEYMFENAGVQIVLTQAHLATELLTGDRKVLELDGDLVSLICRQFSSENVIRAENGLEQSDLAYVIYTSGTTGQAKGVMVSHHAAMSYCHYGLKTYYKPELAGSLVVTSSSVDMTLPALFLPLFSGGTVQLLSGSIVLDALSKHLTETDKNYLIRMTPSHAQGLLSLLPESLVLSNKHMFVIGGEALFGATVDSLSRRFPAGTVYNHYGPSEGVVGCTINTAIPLSTASGMVPIGTAMDNVKLYVLDKQQQLHLPGSVGELAIGGTRIADGYLNDTARTAQKFIPDPFSEIAGQQLYLTGDLVRWLPDGQLMYIGRSDEQIKVRGVRIEPGEIESCLKILPGIKNCVVMVAAIEGGSESVVAWVVPQTGLEAADDLELQQEKSRLIKEYREALAEYLPVHMIPAVFVFIDKVPLTANGKVDKKRLPKPQQSDLRSEVFVAAETVTEEKLCALWQEVLKLERIGIQDNFFILGGHSLIATQLVSRIREVFSVELPVRLLFEHQTVQTQALAIEQAAQQGTQLLPAITVVSRENPLPLSHAQQRLWFLNRYMGANAVYNIPLSFRLRGNVNEHALCQSLEEIFRRHESLRTRFIERDGLPLQVIDNAPVRFEIQTVNGTAEIQQLQQSERQHCFDLHDDSLARIRLLKDGDDSSYVLLITLHHCVSDRWSLGIFFQEFAALYRAFSQGLPSPLQPLSIQYGDYAYWQRKTVDDAVLDEQLNYWREQLAGLPELLSLPTDRPRPEKQRYQGSRRTIALPEALCRKLQTLSQAQGVTLFMTLLSAYSVLLSRYSGQTDLAIGTPIANRNHQQTEELIGFFVNTLVMRCDLGSDPSFAELLQTIKETALEGYGNQDIPFELLVEKLNPSRKLNHSPLFQVMFAMQSVPVNAKALDGLELDYFDHEADNADENVGSHFALTLSLREVDGLIKGGVEYDTDLFDSCTIEQFLQQYQQLLESIVLNPEQKVSTLALMEPRQQIQQIRQWHAEPKLMSALAAKLPCLDVSGDCNSEFYLLDQQLNIVPAGVVGEVFIPASRYSGAQPPVLWHTPQGHTVMLSRTGLLARSRADGDLVFADTDWNVAAREFENKLTSLALLLQMHEEVKDVVVMTTGETSPEAQVSAVIVPAQTNPEAGQSLASRLKKYIRSQQAVHILPSVIHQVVQIPRNQQGKPDKTRLLSAFATGNGRVLYVAPRNQTEQALVQFWQEMLQQPTVGIDDNFFALGGHSLMTARLLNRIRAELEVELSVQTVFEYPTIREVAQRIEILKDAQLLSQKRDQLLSSDEELEEGSF